MTTPFAIFAGQLRQRARAFRRDENAATAIEFTLLSLPFFLIVGAILQTSVIFLATQVLESAVLDATRQIRTGQTQQAGGTLASFRADVCDRLYGLFPDCAGLHLRIAEVINFQSATVTPPIDMTCTQDCEWTVPETWRPGGGKSVVLVQVHYRYPVYLQFGPLGMSNLPDGSRLIGTATVFQNEPFS